MNMNIRAVAVLLAVAHEIVFLAALEPPCLQVWQTPRNDGSISATVDTGVNLGTKCLRNVPNQCQGGPNAGCVFSFRTNYYICCHDVWLSTALTLLEAANNAKPRCPNGAIPQSGNEAVTCDPQKPNGCIQGYSCTSSASAHSSRNPHLCCKTSTLPSFSTVFHELGLTPTIVPISPTNPIFSITFQNSTDTTSDLVVNMGDDWSKSVVKAHFMGLFAPISVSANIGQVQNDLYHLLIFDSINNKHVLSFQTDIKGGAATATSLAIDNTVSNMIVYPVIRNAATVPSGYQWTNSYVYGPADYPLKYTYPQKYVALLFTTGTTPIKDLGIDVTLITGDFGPNQGGLYNNTITSFLIGKGSKLGPPIAGMYFFM